MASTIRDKDTPVQEAGSGRHLVNRATEETSAMIAHDHPANSLICSHVFHGLRPLLYVYREVDGFWTFTCGQADHAVKEDVMPVCFECALKNNGVYDQLKHLEPAFEARRADAASQWIFAPLQ